MSNRRFEMYEYRQVIHRMRMGQSDRAIAKSKLMGRAKCAEVRAVAKQNGWLEPGPLPGDAELTELFEAKPKANPSQESLSQPHEEKIRKWSEDGITVTAIHRTLAEQYNFPGSYSSVLRMVQRLKGQNPKATCILEFAVGEAAQVDFGAGPVIEDVFTGETVKTWIFVMTLCFSRHMYAEVVTDQKVATWLGCHRRSFEFFCGVPAKVIIDNPKCAITKACFRDPEVQRSYGEMAEGYGFLISPCPPGEPKKKGLVESGVKYVKNSWMPLRRFRTVADANAQLHAWVMETAGNRIHGTTRRKPLTVFAETERPMLRRLPDVPVELATWTRAKLHPDCHVRYEQCLYSAPFRLVHQQLWLKVTDTTVKLYHDLKLVAAHRRLVRPGSRATIDDHYPPEAIAYKTQTPQWCLRQAETVGPHCLRLVKRLFANRVMDNLRGAQGVIALGKKYGAARLEKACKRALFFDNPRYRTVKSILTQGLDQEPLDPPANVVALPSVYKHEGRFLRPAADLKTQAERRRS